MVGVALPSYLQSFADGNPRVEVDTGGKSLRETLDALGERYPGVRSRVLTEQGEVRTHINVFVGDENSRFADGLATLVRDGDEVFILAAVSGG